jgi:hypothetical protein
VKPLLDHRAGQGPKSRTIGCDGGGSSLQSLFK